MNIMIIAAHPDDAEFSIGGTIKTYAANGDNVYLLNLTNGEPTPHGTVETRLKEAEESGEILGITERVVMDLPNRFLEDTIENRKKVAAYIRKFTPDILLVQYHVDAHPDHISSSYLGNAARFYAKLTKSDIPGTPFYPPKILYYYTSHMKLDGTPSFVLPISESAFNEKIRAAQAYQSQIANRKHGDLTEFIKLRGRHHGMQVKAAYGEPFYTPEIIGVESLKNLV